MTQTREMFAAPELAAVFSDSAHVQAMLDFEAALARADAGAGLIPETAADAIAAACRVDLYDVPALMEAARRAGAHSIPLVAALTAQAGEDAGRYVHFGATSQDVIDSAVMLQARAGLEWLVARLLATGARCAALAEEHRHAPMVGRTLLQHATPTTFGLKVAHWLASIARLVAHLRHTRATCLAVQFGGAVGTLASLGDAGLRVLDLLAVELGLPAPDLPWHTDRDRVGRIAAALSVTAGSMSKIATDLLLLSQTDVGEVAEGVAEGKGGSSAMPHKRNPVDATFAVAAARLAQGEAATVLAAMSHEHERSAGAWQAEWAGLPAAFVYTGGAVERVQSALDGLTVDAGRMRANLDLTQGLIMTESLTMALAASLGRPQARGIVDALVEDARSTGRHLREIALADAHVRGALSDAQIERALDPGANLGSADAFIDRALAAFDEVARG